MSIGFSFTMEPKRKFFIKPNIQYHELIKKIKELGDEQDCILALQDNYIKLEYCPEGYFWIYYDREANRLSGECQTNVAGPGFHAASIDFLEALAESGHLKLEVEDETNYFIHRDFERMREEHFYPWLDAILELICDQYTGSDFRICWPADTYAPKSMDKTVVMPIRRFSINEIKLFRNGRIADFAKEFFCWNQREKDAYFYRNCGLALMSAKCFFMPSKRSVQDERINQACIQLLEQGLFMMKRIPIPIKDYESLCRLDERKTVDLTPLTDLDHACEIGYRKQEISIVIGQFTLTLPGNYLEEYSETKHTVLFYDGAEENWHNIRITSYTYLGEDQAVFTEKLFAGKDVGEVREFPVGEGDCRLAVFKPYRGVEEDKDDYYHMAGQLILDKQLLLISCTYQKEEETETIISWYQGLSGKKERKSEEKQLSYR